VQTLILTASVIWRDSIPDQNLPHVLEKGSTPPDVDTAFGLVLMGGAILDGSAGLTHSHTAIPHEYLILIKTKEFQRSGADNLPERVVTDFLLLLAELPPHSPLNNS